MARYPISGGNKPSSTYAEACTIFLALFHARRVLHPAMTGCDSLVTLDLTIDNSLTGTDAQNACDSYTWIDGVTYTSSNSSATILLTASGGCDSLVTLDLTIGNSNTGTDTQTACDSYTWVDGNTYTVSNNSATWILTNAAGCDSTVTLDLTITNSNSGTYSSFCSF